MKSLISVFKNIIIVFYIISNTMEKFNIMTQLFRTFLSVIVYTALLNKCEKTSTYNLKYCKYLICINQPMTTH